MCQWKPTKPWNITYLNSIWKESKDKKSYFKDIFQALSYLVIYVPYMICLKHMNNKLNTGKGTLTFKHNTLPKYADIWNFLQSTLKSFGLLNKFTLGQAWLCIFKNNMVGDAVSCNGNWGCGSCPVCFGGTLGNHNRTFLKLHSIQTLRYCVHLSSILHLSV